MIIKRTIKTVKDKTLVKVQWQCGRFNRFSTVYEINSNDNTILNRSFGDRLIGHNNNIKFKERYNAIKELCK
jgi:hypothetical protein